MTEEELQKERERRQKRYNDEWSYGVTTGYAEVTPEEKKLAQEAVERLKKKLYQNN